MQIKYQQQAHSATKNIREASLCEIAYARQEKLALYEKLIQEGCARTLALEAIGCSKSSYYRWKQAYSRKGLVGLEKRPTVPKHKRSMTWDRETERLVYKVRRQHPLWGRLKLQAVLKREYGISLSVSMVGRILTRGVVLGRIKPVRYYYGHVKASRPRSPRRYAKRYVSGMQSQIPGELIQVDHMSVEASRGLKIEEFKGVCPITKLTAACAYKSATAKDARDFLDRLTSSFPFAVRSIQVDGGSEFMAEFEQACEAKGILLYVLPPRSPELNGHVERCNSTTKYEFYYQHSGLNTLETVRCELKRYCEMYNTYRPHQSLDQLTPMAYYETYWKEVLSFP